MLHNSNFSRPQPSYPTKLFAPLTLPTCTVVICDRHPPSAYIKPRRLLPWCLAEMGRLGDANAGDLHGHAQCNNTTGRIISKRKAKRQSKPILACRQALIFLFAAAASRKVSQTRLGRFRHSVNFTSHRGDGSEW